MSIPNSTYSSANGTEIILFRTKSLKYFLGRIPLRLFGNTWNKYSKLHLFRYSGSNGTEIIRFRNKSPKYFLGYFPFETFQEEEYLE